MRRKRRRATTMAMSSSKRLPLRGWQREKQFVLKR
jgi:hypothetical protein